MSRALAVVPVSPTETVRPDSAWIKVNVPIVKIAHALGLRIRHRRIRCLRPENHAHGDIDPSLHLYDRKNRMRCFTCELRGSNIDLVMISLGLKFGDAVKWIAERFAAPNVRVGRPVGSRASVATPYRVGAHGSEFEVLVRSGMFGRLTAPERSVLIVLSLLRDSDSGLTLLSYSAIMRYLGVAGRSTVSRALKRLARLRAIEVHQGARIGITRECSAYRVTLDDPKFLGVCDEVFQSVRGQISEEREYRKDLRRERMQKARRPLTLNTTEAGGLRPPDHPASLSLRRKENTKEKPSTCEGLNLSPASGLTSNKPVHALDRKIGITTPGQLQRDIETILSNPKYRTGAAYVSERD